MPPGGEDLITRGEWIPLSSLLGELEFLLPTRPTKHLLPDFFPKLAVSRKPSGLLGFADSPECSKLRKGLMRILMHSQTVCLGIK